MSESALTIGKIHEPPPRHRASNQAMKLPDTSDSEKMAEIGRISVLKRARLDAAKSLRDKLIPVLNSLEHADTNFDVSGVVELVEFIQSLTQEITLIQKVKK